jgi:hypothetical protein
MNKNIVNVCAGLGLAIVSLTAMADSTPVMFSSINGFSAPTANEVNGVRLTVFHSAAVSVTGVDFALLGLSEAADVTGINWGLLGANLGFINVTNNVKGANISAVNYSEGYTMVDVGLANLSNDSHVQVGLINCAENGFLPCFPFVNFAL